MVLVTLLQSQCTSYPCDSSNDQIIEIFDGQLSGTAMVLHHRERHVKLEKISQKCDIGRSPIVAIVQTLTSDFVFAYCLVVVQFWETETDLCRKEGKKVGNTN